MRKAPQGASGITMEQTAVPESLGEANLHSQPGGGGGNGGLGCLFLIDLHLKLHIRIYLKWVENYFMA